MVHAPDVDEGGTSAPSTRETVTLLARLKGISVLEELSVTDAVVVACDSLLEIDGEPVGKPDGPETAAEIWRRIRGRQGVLWTGHHVTVLRDGVANNRELTVGTSVWFGNLKDEEIAAYVATGEPIGAAGAFTIEGFGAPFIERIEGDHHNVVGISVPNLRLVLAEMGIAWHSLWQQPASRMT